MIRAEAQAGRYTIAVCKGTAFLEETKALLRARHPGESTSEFRDRVLREDLLGRMTAYRASDIVRRVFAWRLLRPDNRPAILLKRLLEQGQPGQLFSDLCLLYAARNDDLIRDAVSHLYWPALSEAGSVLVPPMSSSSYARLSRTGASQSRGPNRLSSRWPGEFSKQ